MGVKLNLAGTIENKEGFVRKVVDISHEFINIFNEVLHAVYQATVWSVVHEFLGIIDRDHVSDIQITSVLEYFCSWVQVNYFERPFVTFTNFLESMA